MGPPGLPRDMARSEPAVPEYVVEALADEQRRDIVAYLSGADGPVGLGELARELDDAAVGGPPSKRLLVRLHHVQLPKLDDAGLVEYAPPKRRVAYAGEWVLPDADGVADVEDVPEALASRLA